MNNLKKNRILYLDVLRFFCIFIVFIHHFLMDVSVVRNMHDLNFLYIILFDRKNFNIGMCAIALYFFISGAAMMLIVKRYIRNNDDFDIVSFYKDRLTRILIPFYIVYVMYFIIRFISTTFFKSQITGNLFPENPYILSIFYTLCGVDEYMNASGFSTFSLGIGEWFLGCIIFCYMVFPFLYKLYKKNRICTFLILTIYFVLIQRFLPYFHTKPYTNFFNHIYNFFLGMVIVDINLNIFLDKYKKLVLPFSIVFCLFLILYNNYELPVVMNIKTTISSLCIFSIFYYLEKYFQKSDKLKIFITGFTAISFEIFLVHHAVIYEVDRAFLYKHVDKKLIVILFLDIVLTYVFARIVHRLNGYIRRVLSI